MDTFSARDALTTSTKLEAIGRITTVTGSQSTVELTGRTIGGESPTVGKFMGVTAGKTVIIGLITEVGEQLFAVTGSNPTFRKLARLDLIG
jgi:hypothetical protein